MNYSGILCGVSVITGHLEAIEVHIIPYDKALGFKRPYKALQGLIKRLRADGFIRPCKALFIIQPPTLT